MDLELGEGLHSETCLAVETKVYCNITFIEFGHSCRKPDWTPSPDPGSRHAQTNRAQASLAQSGAASIAQPSQAQPRQPSPAGQTTGQGCDKSHYLGLLGAWEIDHNIFREFSLGARDATGRPT